MDSPKYALLLERLCVASDAHDWVTCEALFPLAQKAHADYNYMREKQGKQPVLIHVESWDRLYCQAHAFVWN